MLENHAVNIAPPLSTNRENTNSSHLLRSEAQTNCTIWEDKSSPMKGSSQEISEIDWTEDASTIDETYGYLMEQPHPEIYAQLTDIQLEIDNWVGDLCSLFSKKYDLAGQPFSQQVWNRDQFLRHHTFNCLEFLKKYKPI
jgi:hypothetical protein